MNANPIPTATIPNSNDWIVPKTPQASAQETADDKPVEEPVITDEGIEEFVASLRDDEAAKLRQRIEENQTRRERQELARKIMAEAERICRTAARGTQGYVYESVIKALVNGQPIPAFWSCTLCGQLHDESADPTLRCPTRPEMDKGTTTVEKRRRDESGELVFKYPQVIGTPYDYVIGAANSSTEGWFMRSDVHLVGGPSGASKSTFMVDLLDTQLKGERFLGHQTFGLPYLILMSDRGRFAHLRTANRMRFDPDLIPIKFLPSVTGLNAAKAILKEIEAAPTMPAIVFIEGADMLMENASKMELVVPFLDAVQKIAARYHISLICSVGSPKTKKGEGYVSKRDNIFGTVAWGRKTETIVVLQCHEGDDMDARRNLSVLLRNGPSEKYSMRLENGRLIEVPKEETATAALPPQIQWFKQQKDWFTSQELQDGMATSKATADRHIKSAHSRGFLKMKPGPNGGARLYRWNSEPAQPVEVEPTEPVTDPLADVPESGL
jgi:rubrerythrin